MKQGFWKRVFVKMLNDDDDDDIMINNYKDMYNRAIYLGKMQARIWKQHYVEDLDMISITDDHINVSGTDYTGNDIMEEIPLRYMDMSNYEIQEEIKLEYRNMMEAYLQQEHDKDIERKNQRRETYLKLKEEFGDE